MVDITALQQAVANAEQYLVDVSSNLPCGGSCSGFTGAATANEIFRVQREKDYATGSITLESAKMALQNGLNQLKTEVETAALIPQKVIENNTILGPNLAPQQITPGQTNKIPILPIVTAVGVGLIIFSVVRRKRKN